MQIHEYIKQLAGRFKAAKLAYGHGTDNPADDAAYLVMETLGLDWDGYDSQLDRPLDTGQLRRLEELVRQRLEDRVPVAYLVGRAWFAGYSFHIDQRALIPRSPIAELIRNHFEPLLEQEPGRILDLCTGSGCIGIACALEFTEARVDLADISQPALDLARTNIHRYELQQRVNTVRSDLFASLTGGYDLIVCNPPYVAEHIVSGLPAEFSHEPQLGLTSADEGLQIPLRILASAGDYLRPQGVLILEVGCAAEALQLHCPAVPFLWLEFEYGGDGVLMLSAEQLLKYRASFN